ncbi:hypothetical protein Tco_1491931 [Tanacetum coccineum]
MVAFLEKSTGSVRFHQVIDFLNRSHIGYALTKKPAISVSFIKQFWRSAEASTNDNGEDWSLEDDLRRPKKNTLVLLSLSHEDASSKQGRKIIDEEVHEKSKVLETKPFIQEVTPTEVI